MISGARRAGSAYPGRRTANKSSCSSSLASSSVDGSYAKTGRIICGEQESGESNALSAQSMRQASRSNTLRACAARRISREDPAPPEQEFERDARCAATAASQRAAQAHALLTRADEARGARAAAAHQRLARQEENGAVSRSSTAKAIVGPRPPSPPLLVEIQGELLKKGGFAAKGAAWNRFGTMGNFCNFFNFWGGLLTPPPAPSPPDK